MSREVPSEGISEQSSSQVPAAQIQIKQTHTYETDRDQRTLIHHLGLPFYYRHWPLRGNRRLTFWVVLLLLVGFVGLNVLGMPWPKDFILKPVIDVFFNRPIYKTFASAGQSMCYQAFGLVIILSGIFAPLLATYNLSSERNTGTIEFLHLAPISTFSIVTGKLFASTAVLHLISIILLCLGTVFGYSGGLAMGTLLFIAMHILLCSRLLHAIGGYLACTLRTFRGFGGTVSFTKTT